MRTAEQHLLASLRALGRLNLADHPLPELLRRITSIANDAVPRSAMVGLTLDVAGHASTAACTDELVADVDQAQYESGIGPCLDAARHGLVFAIPSTPNDDRWKSFSTACSERGVLSTLSTPVLPRSAKRAALNFYALEEGAFDNDDVEVAETVAAQAAVAIENSEAYWSVRELADQLGVALETRAVIEQAKGLLMAEGRTGAEAFDLLRTASQRSNRKLRAVAADLVAEAEQRASGIH